MNTQNSNYSCPKCANAQYEVDEIRTTGGIWSKFFNIQNKRYTSITCEKCKYTEFYKGTQSTLGNIIDFFGN